MTCDSSAKIQTVLGINTLVLSLLHINALQAQKSLR